MKYGRARFLQTKTLKNEMKTQEHDIRELEARLLQQRIVAHGAYITLGSLEDQVRAAKARRLELSRKA